MGVQFSRAIPNYRLVIPGILKNSYWFSLFLFMGVEQLVVHSVWDREGAGSSPVSRTKNKWNGKENDERKKPRPGQRYRATTIAGSPNWQGTGIWIPRCWFESSSGNKWYHSIMASAPHCLWGWCEFDSHWYRKGFRVFELDLFRIQKSAFRT